MALAASEQLKTIGFDLVVNDVESSVWNDSLEANTAQLWCAAWQATADPDMYQVYYSANAHGEGTNSNHYQITDSELDTLIVDARSSSDNAYRKATYKTCFDIILDWGVELPLYQRKGLHRCLHRACQCRYHSRRYDSVLELGCGDRETLEMN